MKLKFFAALASYSQTAAGLSSRKITTRWLLLCMLCVVPCYMYLSQNRPYTFHCCCLPAGPQDVFCLNSTVGFDSYVTYVFASLVLGARLVVPGPTAHLDPTGMACLIATHGITTMEVGGHQKWFCI